MNGFLALTALAYLVAGRPTCSRPQPIYGSNSTTIPTAAANITVPTSNNSISTTTKIATGWYPGWYNSTLPPSEIPWEKYSALTYSFAVTTPDVSQLELPDDESVLQDFVTQAHSHNVKALISVGGWTGSVFFSSAAATAENRTAFTKTLMAFATKYNLDGIDFDWEYPNKQGLGCNVISSNDSSNFLALLQEVRQNVGQNFQLTAATGMQPFNGPDGTPMSNVSAFAEVLNHISIMAYDVYGTFSNVGAGPNAPLNDSCVAPKNQLGSGVDTVKAWTNAGFPSNQILLGVPSYGRSYTVESSVIDGEAEKLAEFPSFDQNQVPLGTGETSSTLTKDRCGAYYGPSGVFDYNDMVQRGFFDSTGTTPASGLLYKFDNCSQTAYIYNSTSQVLINFDNTDTYKSKGQFIKLKNLGGFAMWHIASDTSNGTLHDTIVANM